MELSQLELFNQINIKIEDFFKIASLDDLEKVNSILAITSDKLGIVVGVRYRISGWWFIRDINGNGKEKRIDSADVNDGSTPYNFLEQKNIKNIINDAFDMYYKTYEIYNPKISINLAKGYVKFAFLTSWDHEKDINLFMKNISIKLNQHVDKLTGMVVRKSFATYKNIDYVAEFALRLVFVDFQYKSNDLRYFNKFTGQL